MHDLSWLPQLRVKMSERLRCSFSRDDKKAPLALTPSLAVLKGMGLQLSRRPCGLELVDEQMATECMKLWLRAENPEWIILCAMCLIFVCSVRRPNDDHKSSSAELLRLRAKMAERLRCIFSKDDKKAPSALSLSPAVLKGIGLRQSWRPWGLVLVDDDDEHMSTSLRLLSRALNPEWILCSVVGLIFIRPLRDRRNDDHESGGHTR
ncbi:uncharacterized protein LOC124701514 isoform X2 [Lolium rigidum]|uniref:uncharacterized protein LOC124701514 isoform X2 n=1 Tax=Lolium rigidum TaxID=89674 RepID=UPI001F5CF47D|nr:uncharacterized protein LOC124701514 isoform X2 [Lolium rigidum]XP_047089547.1 uncharacterized protein LOC124701514 isoform X2 [Lolium rigidum]